MPTDIISVSAGSIDRPELWAAGADPAAFWLAVRVRLPRIGIGYVDWVGLSGNLQWPPSRAAEALRHLEDLALLYADGRLGWAPGALEADPRLSLEHPAHRTGVENALERLPDCGLVRAFRRAYGLGGEEWAPDAAMSVADALRGETLQPARGLPGAALIFNIGGEFRSKNGAGKGLERQPCSDEALRHKQGRNGGPGHTLDRQPPTVTSAGVDRLNTEDVAEGFSPQPQKVVCRKLSSSDPTDPPPPVYSTQQQSSGSSPPVRLTPSRILPEMWKVVKAEGMAKPRHQLIGVRREKLKMLWEEQLKHREDPLAFLAEVCRAVRNDPWWGERSDTWLPEICWRNPERREKFTLKAEEQLERGNGRGAGAAPSGSQGGDRYAHLTSRAGKAHRDPG